MVGPIHNANTQVDDEVASGIQSDKSLSLNDWIVDDIMYINTCLSKSHIPYVHVINIL